MPQFFNMNVPGRYMMTDRILQGANIGQAGLGQNLVMAHQKNMQAAARANMLRDVFASDPNKYGGSKVTVDANTMVENGNKAWNDANRIRTQDLSQDAKQSLDIQNLGGGAQRTRDAVSAAEDLQSLSRFESKIAAAEFLKEKNYAPEQINRMLANFKPYKPGNEAGPDKVVEDADTARLDRTEQRFNEAVKFAPGLGSALVNLKAADEVVDGNKPKQDDGTSTGETTSGTTGSGGNRQQARISEGTRQSSGAKAAEAVDFKSGSTSAKIKGGTDDMLVKTFKQSAFQDRYQKNYQDLVDRASIGSFGGQNPFAAMAQARKAELDRFNQVTAGDGYNQQFIQGQAAEVDSNFQGAQYSKNMNQSVTNNFAVNTSTAVNNSEGGGNGELPEGAHWIETQNHAGDRVVESYLDKDGNVRSIKGAPEISFASTWQEAEFDVTDPKALNDFYNNLNYKHYTAQKGYGLGVNFEDLNKGVVTMRKDGKLFEVGTWRPNTSTGRMDFYLKEGLPGYLAELVAGASTSGAKGLRGTGSSKETAFGEDFTPKAPDGLLTKLWKRII